MRPMGTAAELERRRRLAIQRIREGHRPSEVAHFLGVDESSIRRWMISFRKHGEKGLKAQLSPGPGRPPKLTRTQEKIVLRWVKEDPMDHGFPTELWTAARLAQLIGEEFGVRFNPRYLSSWLRARAQTPQMPQRTPRQRDPEKIDQWLAADWPRIKKKRSTKMPILS